MISFRFSVKLPAPYFCSTFFRCAASAPPPGIGRLALSATERCDLENLARENGPVKALEHLVSKGYLERDALQTECAEQLHKVRNAANAYASDMLEWRRRYAIWLATLRQQLREARKKAKENAKALAKDCARDVSKADPSGSSASRRSKPVGEKLRARLERLAGTCPPRPMLETQGLFLWGGVGRGKSLLMDLFVASFGPLSTGPAVQRQHYHDFMSVVHQCLHKKRPADAKVHAVKAAALELSQTCPTVLCLDEFQVTNIADAVILRDLFANLLSNGTLIVTTCNRPPEDLYKDGLNHMIYMPPFLKLLRDRIKVHHLDSCVDYRVKMSESGLLATSASERQKNKQPIEGMQPDFVVAPAGTHSLDASFMGVAHAGAQGESSSTAASGDLLVSWGRRLKCKAVQGGVARFSFQEICGAPLGADDYSALIQKNSLHTFVVSDIPRFTLTQHNEARRFTNFVDCLYEGQCRLICTAEAPPEELMSEMESLSDVPIEPQPASNPVNVERTTRRHGDLSFEVSALSPCRPDTFATAEADAEAGTGDAEILQAVLAARRNASAKGGKLEVNSADPTEQGGVAGVTSAALVSLQESGFAARRCVSRLQEMSTEAYHKAHRMNWALTL